MTRHKNSWHPVCCAVLTSVAIAMGMMLDDVFDWIAAALLMYPMLLLGRSLMAAARRD